MEHLDERRSREILEVAADANLDEISRAYHMLKQIHGKSSGICSAPAMDEFSGEARQDVLDEIEAAYALLRALKQTVQPDAIPAFQPPLRAPAPTQPQSPAVPPAEPTALGKARTAAGLSLEEVLAETNIRMDYLVALEEEAFGNLRLPMVAVRGYLTAYVNAIGLSADEVVPAYMRKFSEWQSQHRPS